MLTVALNVSNNTLIDEINTKKMSKEFEVIVE